ncbi:hypothetical protein [Streptomyces flaveolus]|uniref:hypothetical protein n=1 Tax=Streptomyces flaveolus TaxID=67297 RepID=UPI0033DB9E44
MNCRFHAYSQPHARGRRSLYSSSHAVRLRWEHHGQEGRRGRLPKAAAPVSVKVGDSEYGRILVDQSGRTLYTFTKDKAGVSNCGKDCIAVWPAVTSPAPKAGAGAQKSLSLFGRPPAE